MSPSFNYLYSSALFFLFSAASVCESIFDVLFTDGIDILR